MKSSYAHYLPRPAEPSPWGIDLLGSGFARIEPGKAYPPRGHPADHLFVWERGRVLPEFQAILISQGRGELEIAGVTGAATVEAPALFLVFPGVWHRYRPERASGWHEHWIGFDGSVARRLWQSGEISERQSLFAVGPSERLMAQFELAHEEIRSEALGFRRVAASAIMQILALASTLPQRRLEETQAMRQVVRRACLLLRERSDQPVSPADLAAELHVGYSYFRRLFKRYTGESPNRYHATLRLQRGQRLLRYSDRSVSEVADALGFPSPFHFSSWFKKETGASPKAWREQNRAPGAP